jgi:LuxR family maltose regulon positive regulatory protein
VNRPVLAIALAGTRMSTGDAAGVGQLLDVVEASLDPSAGPPIVFDEDEFAQLPAQLAVYRAGLALLSGDIDATVTYATRALELADPADHLRRGAATALIGLARWATGDLVTAERRYGEAISHLLAAGHLSDALGCSLALADIHLALGQLGDAQATFELGLRWTAESPGLRGAADMHVGLAEVLLERNDLAAAAGHLQAAVDLGERAGLPQNAYRWRVAMARLRQANGDLDGAIELLDEAEPLYDTDFSPPVRPVSAIRARAQVARGDLASARRWASDRGLVADGELVYVREYEHVTFARILLARHEAEGDTEALADAVALLKRLLVAAEAGQRKAVDIEILMLLASAHRVAGDGGAATAAMEEAVRRAAAEGYVRVLLDAGAAVAPARAQGPWSSALIDELSVREIDVLRLLRSDLSGPDIARELHVSLNTFRTHTKNIYAKLGVNNRREAIRRAAELGL